MSRRPTSVTPGQLREAARAAVASAVAQRTTPLSEQEARNTSGGAVQQFVITEPILLGMFPAPDPGDILY